MVRFGTYFHTDYGPNIKCSTQGGGEGGRGIFMQKISEVNYPIRQNFYFDSFLLQNYTMSQNLTSKALLDPLFP